MTVFRRTLYLIWVGVVLARTASEVGVDTGLVSAVLFATVAGMWVYERLAPRHNESGDAS